MIGLCKNKSKICLWFRIVHNILSTFIFLPWKLNWTSIIKWASSQQFLFLLYTIPRTKKTKSKWKNIAGKKVNRASNLLKVNPNWPEQKHKTVFWKNKWILALSERSYYFLTVFVLYFLSNTYETFIHTNTTSSSAHHCHCHLQCREKKTPD